jgi:hypothetical protein
VGVRQDVKNLQIHNYYNMWVTLDYRLKTSPDFLSHIVYGQKPE